MSQSYVVPFYLEGLAKEPARREPLLRLSLIALQSKVADAYPSGSDIRPHMATRDFEL